MFRRSALAQPRILGRHQRFDVGLDDGIEVDGRGAGRHVDAFGAQRDVAQQVAVEPRVHGRTVGVEQQPNGAGVGIGDGDFAAGFAAEADGDDAHAGLDRGVGCVEGEGVVVLAVGDQQHQARHAAIGAEGVDAFADGVAEPRAAARHRVVVHAAEHEVEEAVVGGQRAHHCGAAGERHQADPVAAHMVHELGDVGLGARQAVGRGVVRQHALGDVEHHHDVRADLARRDGLDAAWGLRAHQCADAEQQRCGREHDLRDAALARRAGGQSFLHRRRDEAVQRVAPAQFQIRKQAAQREGRPDAVDERRIGEDHVAHHGTRTNSAARPNQPSAASSSPKRSGSANSSSYWRERSSVILLRSKRSISA